MIRQTIATNRTKSKCLTTVVPINEAHVHIHVRVPLRDRSTRSHAGEYGRVQIRTGIEMWGMSRRPIIGICHSMEFISDVPTLSIRDGILDISGLRKWQRGSLNMQNRIGGRIRSWYSSRSRLRDAREASQTIRYNLREGKSFPLKIFKLYSCTHT